MADAFPADHFENGMLSPQYADAVEPGVCVIECHDPGCMRCRCRMGGYTFRWFSVLWMEKYSELSGGTPPLAWRNPWRPGQGERLPPPMGRWDRRDPNSWYEVVSRNESESVRMDSMGEEVRTDEDNNSKRARICRVKRWLIKYAEMRRAAGLFVPEYEHLRMPAFAPRSTKNGSFDIAGYVQHQFLLRNMGLIDDVDSTSDSSCA